MDSPLIRMLSWVPPSAFTIGGGRPPRLTGPAHLVDWSRARLVSAGATVDASGDVTVPPPRRPPGADAWRWDGSTSIVPGTKDPGWTKLRSDFGGQEGTWFGFTVESTRPPGRPPVGYPLYAFSRGGPSGVRAGYGGPPVARPLWVLGDCMYSGEAALPAWQAFTDAALDGRTVIVTGVSTFAPPGYFGTFETLKRCLAARGIAPPEPVEGGSPPVVLGKALVVRCWRAPPSNKTHGPIGDSIWSSCRSTALPLMLEVAAGAPTKGGAPPPPAATQTPTPPPTPAGSGGQHAGPRAHPDSPAPRQGRYRYHPEK